VTARCGLINAMGLKIPEEWLTIVDEAIE